MTLNIVYFQLYVVLLSLFGVTAHLTLSDKCFETNALSANRSSVYFFTFNITKDTLKAKTSISLVDKKVADGKLKSSSNTESPQLPTRLEVFIYSGSSVVKTIYLEHPLLKRVDVYEKKGTITAANLNLTTADFSVRVDAESIITSVIIKEYITRKLVYETAPIPIN